MIQHDGIQDVSIYLGNVCNFDCSYCDRDYIKTTIGGQHFKKHDVPDIINFLQSLITPNGNFPAKMISFHGGEPFVYVDVMDAILTQLELILPDNDLIYFIQTNGSLITKTENFLKKWGAKLAVSISYDFLFQPNNRTEYDIQAATLTLRRAGVTKIQFQTVLPIQLPNVFSMDMIKNILNITSECGVTHINLIPLRHIRGKDKFNVILDSIDMDEFFIAFTRFVEILYVMGIYVVVDGHSKEIDKHYFSNHKQMILSPDGLIYPEYDFLEYKMTKASIGGWRSTKVIPISIERTNETQEDTLILTECSNCVHRDMCGLKFLYQEFDKRPQGNCRDFYSKLGVIIKHVHKLQQHRTLLHSIGI